MCQHCLNFFQFVQAFKTIFLFSYIVNNKRVVGYDNAVRKGDHRHYKEQEESSLFVSLEKLAEDFYRDVEQTKKEITPSVSYDKILFEIAVS
jgi:hypothetical protein